ncbi:hypothetical protein NY08_2925 [Rhodococcus sp. B7740]|uniref:DUF305 domain-containing protein n=1 Tax=Rhodococcus sp. B7740 TaxID=1564114 RepID=UPI0005D9D94F|nr:DUF305 domain-containing protein [Rhodococcus sp. B7740]AJW40935.1 hypothetical protein NY08_2925 [Rhodococcus sp. B7740]
MRTTLVSSLAAATVSAFLLAGCSSDDSSMDGHSMGSPNSSSESSASSDQADASAEFNDADVMFAQMMYPHHAQAVEMAAMVEGRTENPDVVALASAIEAAQQPEMDRMTAWLTEWGQPMPDMDMDMGGMDHSSGMGMMTQQDMDALSAATGGEFDSQWLTMMIEHHEGAIEMANVEIEDGTFPQAQEMARTIVASQQQEIDTMRTLLG